MPRVTGATSFAAAMDFVPYTTLCVIGPYLRSIYCGITYAFLW